MTVLEPPAKWLIGEFASKFPKTPFSGKFDLSSRFAQLRHIYQGLSEKRRASASNGYCE
jgi:hypothetical protein